MECNVLCTERTLKECSFQMEGVPDWEIVARRTGSAHRGYFEAYKHGRLEYYMKQESHLKQFISDLPIVGFLYQNPYHIFRGDECCGFSVRKTKFLGQGRLEFHFNENIYELMFHSKCVRSLMMDGQQVAVYRWFSPVKHLVRYSDALEDKYDILILFAAYIEMGIIDTPNYSAPQNNRIPRDSYLDRARWRPDDDTDKEPFLNKYGL